MKENSSVNNKKDNVSLVLSKVPAKKVLSNIFLDQWFVPGKLRNIIPKETSNNAEATEIS